MRITVAPDSLKESLSAAEAAAAIASGLRRAMPAASIDCAPMADGGEGTVDALVAATGGRKARARVTGPLGEPLVAEYGLLGDGQTAVIEMAAASGLPLVPQERRNPLLTTTRGTGELIRAALDQGVRRILIGVGGSATVDGGAGMAQALGVRFLDVNGKELPPGGGALERLARIDASALDRRVRGVEILVASDVTNPLCGPQGAARIYGPQKGATSAMVERLDRNLIRLAEVIRRDLGVDVLKLPGGGAAGGLGAALVAFLGARICSGAELVMETVGLPQRIAASQWVITGEGRIDRSSAYGKTVAAVARAAQAAGVPVIVLAGSIGPGAEVVHELGVTAFFSILSRPMPLSEALGEASALLEAAAFQVGHLLAIHQTPGVAE